MHIIIFIRLFNIKVIFCHDETFANLFVAYNYRPTCITVYIRKFGPACLTTNLQKKVCLSNAFSAILISQKKGH